MNQPSQTNPPKKIFDQYRDTMRVKQYSQRTDKTYVFTLRAYILFQNKRHPIDMGLHEILQFITHLVSEKKVSASTQNLVLSAILFLYRHVLHLLLDEAILLEFHLAQTKTLPNSYSAAFRLFGNDTRLTVCVARL